MILKIKHKETGLSLSRHGSITTLAQRVAVLALTILTVAHIPAYAEHADPTVPAGQNPVPYTVQPGDTLSISVWKEEDLQRDVLVRPDGHISFPLVGDLHAAGQDVEKIRTAVRERLTRFVPDAEVTVSVLQLSGNKIYVIGKVNRPGEFAMVRNIDVMQALSLAGGTARFAAVKEIVILRRTQGEQTAIPFNYGEVEQGESLDQNIVLQAGDVVVVP